MNILTRQEFSDYFNNLETDKELGGPDSPLWEAECDIPNCQWFVKVRPLNISGKRHGYKNSYWNWCNKNLNGATRCFSSDTDPEGDEWWGFTDKNDIVLWILRWL